MEAKKILECIPIGSHHPISRSELSRILKMSDRDTREMIHQARKIMPIINLQDGNGYYIPDMNVMKDRRKLVLWTNQELSRSKEILYVQNRRYRRLIIAEYISVYRMR